MIQRTQKPGGSRSARATEEDARRSTFEAIGRLTSGVVHDFNHLLFIIKGNIDLLQNRSVSEEERRQMLSDVARAADRGAQLTHELLAFIRRPSPCIGPVDIAAALASIETLLARIAGAKVCLTITHGAINTRVAMHQTDLERVLFNLVANARDAMPNGGELTITTTRSSLRPPSRPARGAAVPQPHALLITVRDNGRGMNPDAIEQAFEPFFTTKHAEDGAGLGLSTARHIVEQSDGHMWIDSVVGVGTTVSILVPIEPPARGSGQPGSHARTVDQEPH